MSVTEEIIAAGMKRSQLLSAPVANWQGIEVTERPNVYVMRYAIHHIGNPFIRALHGGVVGSMMELSAELDLARIISEEDQVSARVELVSSSINYLRVTKDVDLYARVDAIRIARRLAYLDVWCWQDEENAPVSRGSCTLRIFRDEESR